MFLTNLLHLLLRPFHSRQIRRRERHLIDTFHQNVDLMASVMRLDTDLPEIVDLKAYAPRIVKIGDGSGWPWLDSLNPYDVRFINVDPRGHLYIRERLGIMPNVLKPWTIVRHHFENADELCKIVVDERGVHLMWPESYDPSQPFATIQCGAINPRRLDDDGLRYQNACAIVREFTGIETDEHQHFGRTEKIIVWRDQINEPWQVDFKQITPVAV